MPWTTAERVCKSYGGHLATPSDYRDNEELGAFVNAQGVTNFWIGADRIGVPTNDRRVLQYNNGREVRMWVGRWAVDQPSFNTGDCTSIHSSSLNMWGGQPAAGKQRWELTSCETKLASLCQRPVCSQGSFHCSNGRCISPTLKCDGDDDCRDRSDEWECSDNCSQKVRLQQEGGQSEGTYIFPPFNGVQTAGNVDCLLLLETDVGSNIEVAINNLDLAREREELVIMDGGQTPDTSRVVTRLTGRLTRQQFFYSSNNLMILNTRSTRAGTPGEFEVTYKSVKVDVDPTNKLVATDQYQELRSPLSDDYELGSQDLTFIIEAENPRKTITVEIISQDLAPDSVVLFRDGDTVHDGLLATLRGSYRGNGFVLSSGRRLYLNKQTILGGQHSGIAIRYMQGCKVSMNQTTGYISSAGFPTNGYPNAVECEWHVRHPDGEALTLTFDSMNISPDDILKIYDDNNALLESYTRSAIQQPLRIPNGVFSAIFTATSSINEKGFNLTFSKDCPEPDLDFTMSIITPMAQNSYGSSFTVRCKQGSTFLQQEHQSKDQVLMVCGGWGRWNVNTSPKCMRVLCPKAPGLENGYVISSVGDLAYEGSITYECYQGFSITGPNTITCQADGSWTQMPTCETSRCSQLPSGPDNGSSNIDGDGTSYGTIVRFSCNDGYDLIGNTTMLCSSRGQWVGEMPMCKILTCYTPDILNARVSSNTADVFESVTVNCDPGYRTSIMGITTMTCSESRVFVPALKCENIDECAENRPCNKTCIDLPGSYHCECDQGYMVEGDDCRDIDECYPENNCSGTCENFPGGYQCACTEGYSLFDKNGAEDHFLPPGEDGTRLGDVYLINKTCVPKLCNTPAIPLNAIQLTKAPGFYFNDSIDYKCKLGYQLSDQAAGRLTCGADRGWHGIQINCEVIMCDVEPIPLGLENPGMLTPSNVTRVAFGESINITCIVPGFRPVSMFTRTRRCTLINGQYKLDGSALDYECGVIDCGPPLSLAGSRYINVTGTQFGDTAIFECEAQYVLSGASAITGDTTISCQANSQWDLGSLDCSGKRCSDPGQIQFGVQKVSNYRSQVVFECTKQGYELMPMGPLACDLSTNGTVSYNASLPQCVDVNPPVMQSPCTSGTYILELQKFESIGKSFPSITAIDNESGIKELVVEPAWPSKEEYITSAAQVLTFTYTFFDHAGNTAECRVIVKGIDTTPPTITCPTSMELTFRDSPVTVQFNRSTVQIQDDFSDAGKVSVSFTPSIFTLQPSDFQHITSFPKTHTTVIKANATDEAGNQATCEFDLFFKPDVCSRYHIRQHNNTSLACAEDNTGGLICRVTCHQGYRLYENLNTSSVIFSCPGPGQPFSRDTDVTCVNVESGDLEGTYHLLFDGIYNSVSVNNSCYDNYLSIIEDTLASLGEKITSTMCREGANTRISGRGKLDSLIVDETNNQVKVRIEVLLERRPKTDYETCAEGTILYLESALQFDIGEKLSTFRPSQCSSLELEGDGLTFIARGYICDQSDIEATIYIDGDGRDVGICRQCPEGTYRAMDGTCVKCPHGAYSMSKDVSTCRDCPASTGTYKEGAFDSGECLAECGSGTYNAASGLPPCSACPINTYRENSTTCLPCPANTTTKAAGANSSSECTEPCQPGYFNEHDGHAPCSKCPQHTYATEIGRRRCSSCSAGQYTEMTGAVSPEDCLYLSNSTECRSRCVNGLCVNNQHSQSCKCDPGWMGENCDDAFEPCDSSPCHNGGTCTSSGIQYNCSCPNGTSGDQCENITLSCNDQSCLNNGMCENLVGGPMCHCLPGFSGLRCETSEDLCNSQPCQNGGQCVAHDNVRFTCSCVDGYVGPTCAEKADLCYSNPCHNNAVCSTVDTQSYVCDCGPGYDGKWCERRLQMCNTVALCGPGSWCVEYEERDTYICVCPPEAEYSNPTGPRNQTCTLTDFCFSDPCYNGGTCRNGATGYTCNCLPGYDGSRCQHDKDDCVSSPCKNGGLCEDHLLGYTCSCTGYTGNNCETEIDECIFSNCTNPGSLRCQDKLNGYECVCNSGYSGDDCEINVDDCASAPCLHDGMCVDQVDDYKCECLPGWSGRNCEQEISFCSDNPCENGAECKNLFNDYLCRCQLSTFGVNCTESVKICDVANPCVWGSCADVSGNASCSCPTDYVGKRCQEKINPCFSDTGVCQNEGACVSSLDSYECRCQPGYVGPLCSINPPNCNAAQCPPTATCIDLLNTAACRCPLGKEGPMCADDTNSNFDLLFRHSYKTSLASLEYPIPLSSSAFSVSTWVQFTDREGKGVMLSLFAVPVSTWVQFTDREGKGVMLSLFAVPSPNSLNGKTPLLWISEIALHYYDPMTREEFQLPQPVDAINDGKWHYLVVNVNGEKGQLNYIADAVSSNTMTIPMRNFHLNVWIVLGCHYDPESEEPVPGEGFQGKLSRFTLYNRTLDFREEVTHVGNKNVFALFSDSVLQWGLEFVLKSGVQRLVPSGADQTCPTGFTGDHPSCLERVSGKAMVSISSGQCPDNILRYNPGRLTEVIYEVPTFSGQANVRTSLSTEDVYVWGQYPVVVEASNSDGNTALCLFDIYVQNDQCTNPPKPPKAKDLLCLPQTRGEYQMEGYQQCGITCEDGYSPSIPGPHLHTCGLSGNWDPENQFVPYRLSSCGSVNKTKQNLVIEIRYRVPNRECQAVRFALTREIRRTQNDLNGVWNQVCSENDCSDTIISVECLNARRKRQANTESTLLELKADITLPDIS
ncbi:fibropellin-1, partial [Plakobranchus ocellatus]